MKVLYTASEATPFIASGGLADVAGSLPKALRGKRVACRAVIPLYGETKWELREKLEFLCHFDVYVSWRKQYCGVFKATIDGVVYYLIDNEYYFKRKGIYGFFDDAERFAFFSRAVVEMINHIDFVPDIIHSNDWQTALVPLYHNVYYKHMDRYRNIKNVFTIHNIQYQGKYGMETLEDVFGFGKEHYSLFEYDKALNLMKAAIEVSEIVTTVSPTYSCEILNPWFAHGLDAMLNAKSYKLHGILNGIDTAEFNPETDSLIHSNFSVSDLKGKAVNKAELLKEVGLPELPGVPLVGVVTRLVAHKGLDLIKFVLDDIVKSGMQLVVLGSGDYEYESYFEYMKSQHPQNLAVTIGFIPQLARRIYAGADMFLMPSKTEPCGLAQMVALRYGTIPIVRETGGLFDSIKDFGGSDGNGYTFKLYNAHDMLGAMVRARDAYLDESGWEQKVKTAMKADFSWQKSAGEYIKLYDGLID